MMMALACAVVLSGVGGAPALEEAEEAFAQGELDRVLPLLHSLLETPLEPSLHVRALELKALTHVAWRDREAASRTFGDLLTRFPEYTPTRPLSPQVAQLLAEVRRAKGIPVGGLARTTAPPEAPPAQVAPPPSKAGWWAAAAIGVAVVGAGAAAVVMSQPGTPGGTLGRGELK